MPYAEREPYSVSELNAEVRRLIESNLARVAVMGEVSNFRKHSSGHLYLTLKDADAQLRCVCFRSTARTLDVDIEDGVTLVVRGRLTLYEPYGQYQIVADEITLAGRGALERAFKLLLEKLSEEGLFADEHKQPLPRFPMRIAVVTSPTGAAVRDIVSTLSRRWPCVEVLVVPVRVQGEGAAGEVAGAVTYLSNRGEHDLVIVGRGGGSLEDLWAFNEEVVARAIFNCRIPVISAVGHETDFTICDYVADVRAATPTMAAEIATPNVEDVVGSIEDRMFTMERTIRGRLDLASSRLQEMLRSYALGRVRGRIEASIQQTDFSLERLRAAVRVLLTALEARHEKLMLKLNAYNPDDVMARGYAICTDSATGRLIADASDARDVSSLNVRFRDGAVRARVQEEGHDG